VLSGAINEGLIYVKLKPKSERALYYARLQEQIRRELASYSPAKISVEEAEEMGDAKPIQISGARPDLAELDRISTALVESARTVPAS